MARPGRKRPRGTIEKLPSGGLRVKVYTGQDPVTKRRHYLRETVPAGAKADREAQKVLTTVGPGNGDDLGDGVLAGAVHAQELPSLLDREFRLFAAQLAPGVGHGHILLRPGSQQVDFEFGEGGQDVERTSNDLMTSERLVVDQGRLTLDPDCRRS